MATTLFSRGPRGADYFQGGGFPDKTAVTGHGISIYEDAGSQKINWDILIPESYNPAKNLLIDVFWFSVSVTVNAVRLDGRFERLAEDGNPLNSDTFGTTKSATGIVSSTLAALRKTTLTFTNADLSTVAVNEVMRFNLVRNTVHAADTLVGDMALLMWGARQT